jgi:DNA-binding response OmpR family regulator
MSGEDLLQRVRRRNFCVPVLVLTARDAVQEKVELFDLGADDYLPNFSLLQSWSCPCV